MKRPLLGGRLRDRDWWRDSGRVRVAIYVLLGLCVFAILVGSAMPQHYNFGVGQISPTTIAAPVNAVDTTATAAARSAAEAAVKPRYQVNAEVEVHALASLEALFSRASFLRAAGHGVKLQERVRSLRSVAGKQVPELALRDLLTMSDARYRVVQSDAVRITQRLLLRAFTPTDMTRSTMLVDAQLVGLNTDPTTRLVIGQLVLAQLRPNLRYNALLTEQARIAAAKAVPEVWINRGDIVVRRGELITPLIMGQLRDLKLLRAQPDDGMVLGFAIFVALLTLATATFVQLRRAARISHDNVHLGLYALLVLLFCVLVRVSRAAVDAGLPDTVAFALPIAMDSMMVAMFFGTSLAMLTTALLALLVSSAYAFSFAPFFIMMIGGLGATMAMTRANHRGVFMRAGFLTAGLNVVSISIMQLLLSTAGGWHSYLYALVYGIVGGLLSAVLTIGLLPYLETAFGVVTHMGLLELANPNHPLLRRMLIEAPGTYHHSLVVGNLAESAAEEVGADPLVCRVGAYYHDVGKMKRPLFFVENQLGGDNPHDRIAPSLSYLIITSHVSDGLTMLREHKLPEPVLAICAEHHGTTLVSYFYNRAQKEDRQPPEADRYRYPGPKPHSKEAAIVMMCDAVEASVRAMPRPTPPRIEALIRKLMRDRLQDGQFDECDITMRDLDKMVDAFMRTLRGMYHERIEYPEPLRLVDGTNK